MVLASLVILVTISNQRVLKINLVCNVRSFKPRGFYICVSLVIALIRLAIVGYWLLEFEGSPVVITWWKQRTDWTSTNRDAHICNRPTSLLLLQLLLLFGMSLCL